jgi:hypothetical protein
MMSRAIALVILLAVLIAPSAAANNQVRLVPDDEEIFRWCGNYLPDVTFEAYGMFDVYSVGFRHHLSEADLAALRCASAYVDIEISFIGVNPELSGGNPDRPDYFGTLYLDYHERVGHDIVIEGSTVTVRELGVRTWDLPVGTSKYWYNIMEEAFDEGVAPTVEITWSLSHWWEADGDCESVVTFEYLSGDVVEWCRYVFAEAKLTGENGSTHFTFEEREMEVDD